MIASEVPLTWRQVVWILKSLEDGIGDSLLSWLRLGPLSEVGTWVWEQWLDASLAWRPHRFVARTRSGTRLAGVSPSDLMKSI